MRSSPPATVSAPTTVSATDVDACVASSTPTTGESMNVSSTATESRENAAFWCAIGTRTESDCRLTEKTGHEEQPGDERRRR